MEMFIAFAAASVVAVCTGGYLLAHSEKHVRGYARRYHRTRGNLKAGITFVVAVLVLIWLTSVYVRTHKEAIALLTGAFIGSFLIEWGLLPWVMRSIRVGEAQQIGTIERSEDDEA